MYIVQRAFCHKEWRQLWEAIVSRQVDAGRRGLCHEKAQGLGFPTTPYLGGVIMEPPDPKWRHPRIRGQISPVSRKIAPQDFACQYALIHTTGLQKDRVRFGVR